MKFFKIFFKAVFWAFGRVEHFLGFLFQKSVDFVILSLRSRRRIHDLKMTLIPFGYAQGQNDKAERFSKNQYFFEKEPFLHPHFFKFKLEFQAQALKQI